MVLWGWQGFIFGYLGLRWLSYIYLLAFFLIWLRPYLQNISKVKKFKLQVNRSSLDTILVILIILGVFIQLTSVWFTGVLTPKGLYFCCGTTQDNILQIAITEQIVKHFPPFEPGMYGRYIQNYHYWDSLVMAELVRVFKLPLIATDYQYMTVFISLFLGLSALVFAQILKLKKTFARWIVFFLYFGGDFVWVLIAIFRRQDFFIMNPLESGQQFLENIPRSVAIIAFFAFASIFLLWLKKKDKYTGILMALVAASLVGFKIYIGIFVIAGLGVLGLYYLIKREFKTTLPLILAAILSLIIYIPVNSNAGGLYFTGLWRFENFIVQPYLGALNRLELARVIYAQHHSIFRVAEYELIYFFVFIFAIFGTKLLGLFQNRKSLSLFPKELNIVLITGIIISAIAGLFFQQTSGGANTFNFLVSVFIIGSIYTALACFYWLDKRSKVIKVLFVSIIILLTVPRGIDQTYNNLVNITRGRGFVIVNKELTALNFLSKQKTGPLVLVDPKISMDAESPYVSFLGNSNMFLSGIVSELQGHGIDYSDRLKARDTIVNSNNAVLVSTYLLKYNIGYIYTIPNEVPKSTQSAYFLKQIFNNKKIQILEVNTQLAEEYFKKYELLKNKPF